MQQWTKLGQVFEVNNANSYLKSHAANPLAIHLRDNVYRVFYSGRSIENKSSVGYVDIDIHLHKVINYPKEPVITFGNSESFYSHGISIGNCYEANNQHYILFMGWQFPKNAHWRGDVGRLRLINNQNLQVLSASPFMGIDEEDQVSLSYPFVMFHEGIYKMWYGSTITWDAGNGEMIHAIKYATSDDAINWKKHGVAIPYEIGVAQAFSKPSVIINDDGYHMWYSYRSGTGTKYRIGYSFSDNGVNWQRKETESGIDVSVDGWDSEMICYPFVFNHQNDLYMLYNGNSHGKYGFGLAILENQP
ncbi:MAG TPA: hypothetical protein DCS93_30410 [Microscillaceae bacterium]|nr:hypothetical protein [Microscillaceae bacterium]